MGPQSEPDERAPVEEHADIGLIAACQQGEARAFRQVFDLYRDRVYGLCRHMAGNEHDAEDLAQESFALAFKGIGAFRADASFGTWLYRIVANCCIAQQRKHKPRFQSIDATDGDRSQNLVPLRAGADPEEQLLRKELVKRAEAAVASLPESQRLIFVLGTQMGMRYRQIGEIVGCSEDAVKVRIHRARKHVRDTLAPYLET
jgi:RNA polymerase sigma-70 factor, ECF subfamily